MRLDAIKHELQLRFDGEDSATLLLSPESSTILRWTLLGVSGFFFPTNKVVAMRSILWAQLWAA